MPSSGFHAQGQTRAIPMVTVSLASGHLRQTRLATHLDTQASPSTAARQDDIRDRDQDQPPSYDSLVTSSNSSDQSTVATASPSNADLTDAVLHLSRTLVSASKPIPDPTPRSWVFMMIYSWTHTQRTATRLYHILTKPGSMLKEIQEHRHQTQQLKRQRKSIQQQTEEEDRMQDDPDMQNGTATEMMPVSMINTRKVIPDDQRPPDSGHGHGDISSDDSDEGHSEAGPRKPRRRIDKYRNPFGTNVDSDMEQEDDEGWLGRGESCSEYGETKTNSVRLTTPSLAHSFRRPLPEFSTPSLGPAMDPRQFEDSSATSVFNRPRPSSSFLRPISPTLSHNDSTYSQGTTTTATVPHLDRVPSLSSDQIVPQQDKIEFFNDGSPPESPWSEQSDIGEELWSTPPSHTLIASTSAAFTTSTSTVISTSSSASSISGPSSSFIDAVS